MRPTWASFFHAIMIEFESDAGRNTKASEGRHWMSVRWRHYHTEEQRVAGRHMELALQSWSQTGCEGTNGLDALRV
jgi:hypothetical protein